MKRLQTHLRSLHAVMLIVMVFLLYGCPATKQARTVERLGFLKDLYPVMTEGNESAGESLLIYKNPKVALLPPNSYTKILLDPVLIFRGPESKMHGISQSQAQLLADTFYALIYQELSKDFEMVDKPGPSILRVQVAMTHLEESWPMLDVVSAVPAPMNALAVGSLLKTAATGKPAFTGEAVIEAKVSDAATGEVLRAMVDRRVGTKKLDAQSFDTWADVYESLDIGRRMADTTCARHGNFIPTVPIPVPSTSPPQSGWMGSHFSFRPCTSARSTSARSPRHFRPNSVVPGSS